ncbi:hypothetical protein PHYBLDRAFT_166318 [Phycomyces blakesleeanus NRRL 1555(-)]|uniref:Uncharacterized protein n=1 Tax=Phycomyces blakesleeanus (strain ATCC 8743b / DSM 1359 / FGSC 10004 / NBRC 33097 / NRRL 1555) TaxID=763407 RepID=A0A162Q1I6_PHYB8|nr:hypothetical protein PHYBLDRAFT_166318 [Phycomyces blakesleeanus NRRL 1555(-)]OAD76346.1 hypothetical protein PHYBLDRAFT_166318 [Phycomyces blakesleeanus NRRL 1555(-)]|eukprot:XP_018294386.1 hypothetical protein PHYBLDRAFT_166318 [Phycomyces blakesleeanus NRRL 1555(-)]
MTQIASQTLIQPSPNRTKRRRLPLRTAVEADFVSSASKLQEAKEFLMYTDTPEAKIVAGNLKELWSPTDDGTSRKHSPVMVGTPTTNREFTQSQQSNIRRPQNLMERLNAIEADELVDITMHSIVPRNIDDMFKESSKDQFAKRVLGLKGSDEDSDDELTELEIVSHEIEPMENVNPKTNVEEELLLKEKEEINTQSTQKSVQDMNEVGEEAPKLAEIEDKIGAEAVLEDKNIYSNNDHNNKRVDLEQPLQEDIPTQTLKSHLTKTYVGYRLFVCTTKQAPKTVESFGLIPLSSRIQNILEKRKNRNYKRRLTTLEILRKSGALNWITNARDSDPRKKGLGDARMKRLRRKAGFEWCININIHIQVRKLVQAVPKDHTKSSLTINDNYIFE